MLQNLNLYTGLSSSSKIKVKGMKGAELYPLPFGSFITLYDEEDQSIFYQKEVDTLGVTTIKRFRFVEEPLDPVVENNANYITKEEFNELKEEVRNVHKLLSNSINNGSRKHKSNEPVRVNNEDGKEQPKSSSHN